MWFIVKFVNQQLWPVWYARYSVSQVASVYTYIYIHIYSTKQYNILHVSCFMFLIFSCVMYVMLLHHICQRLCLNAITLKPPHVRITGVHSFISLQFFSKSWNLTFLIYVHLMFDSQKNTLLWWQTERHHPTLLNSSGECCFLFIYLIQTELSSCVNVCSPLQSWKLRLFLDSSVPPVVSLNHWMIIFMMSLYSRLVIWYKGILWEPWTAPSCMLPSVTCFLAHIKIFVS